MATQERVNSIASKFEKNGIDPLLRAKIKRLILRGKTDAEIRFVIQ